MVNASEGENQPSMWGGPEKVTGDASGVRPGGEDMRSADVLVGGQHNIIGKYRWGTRMKKKQKCLKSSSNPTVIQYWLQSNTSGCILRDPNLIELISESSKRI